MSYRSLGSDEVTLRNCRPVGRRKGNMSLSDPLAAGVVVDLHKPGLSGIRIRLPRLQTRRNLISVRFFFKHNYSSLHQKQPRVFLPALHETAWGYGAAEILVESNIIIDANKLMVFRSAGAGSVVAYNYADDGWISSAPWWAEAGINASHFAGPHHVLFESNYSFKASSDFTWGNSVYITFFRNVITGLRRDFVELCRRPHRELRCR
jgi:hypothetical protein